MPVTEPEQNAVKSRLWRAIAGPICDNRWLFVGIAIVVAIALVPLYGILIPANTDLGEHVLIAKLLWEKLAGVSGLDLEISTFLGYRLLPFGIAGAISVFERAGIPLIYLPKAVAVALMSLHAAIVAAVMYFTAKEAGDRTSYLYSAIFGLPAVAIMYSASWFMGFINFTLGLSLVVGAVCLTEWFLRDGKRLTVILLFACLFFAYAAHPFAPIFWVLWCACRGVMSIVAWNFRAEWKRLAILPMLYLPVVLYHYIATKGTELEPRAAASDISPVVSYDYWLARMTDIWHGVYLQGDDNSSGAFFAAFFLILVGVTTVMTFIWGTRRLRAVMLTCIMFFLAASLLEERFVPTPGLHWLAYEFRFFSATGLICLALSGVVLLRLLARSRRGVAKGVIFGVIGAFCVAVPLGHLVSVSRAYERFDGPGREYTAKILNDEEPAAVMPSSPWHPDGSFLRLYVCLKQRDCNPEGTPFHDLGGDLYVVKIMTGEPLTSGVNDPLKEQSADGENVAPGENAGQSSTKSER